MKTIIYSLSLIFSLSAIAQQNKLYINLATHNEMIDEHYDIDENEFNNAKSVSLNILNHVNSVNAKWNFQTCSKFVLGNLIWDNAASSSTDLLEQMYLSGNVEIDPRDKRELPVYQYNIADVYHLLDSCGVTSTHTVGGFLAYPYANEDWTQFRNVKTGAVYGNDWQADIIWGGGSPGHIQDLNDYGVWRPLNGDSENNLYTHTPFGNLLLIGNGCAPVIYDTTTNVQWIVNLIRNNIQNIQNNLWPTDQFYSLTVMTNVKHFGSPNYFQKVKTVLDSIASFVADGGAEWATITEKKTIYEQWSSQNNIEYSQWSCENATNSLKDIKGYDYVFYPNPTSTLLFIEGLDHQVKFELLDVFGKIVSSGIVNNHENMLNFDQYSNGIYYLKIDNLVTKILKE